MSADTTWERYSGSQVKLAKDAHQRGFETHHLGARIKRTWVRIEECKDRQEQGQGGSAGKLPQHVGVDLGRLRRERGTRRQGDP